MPACPVRTEHDPDGLYREATFRALAHPRPAQVHRHPPSLGVHRRWAAAALALLACILSEQPEVRTDISFFTAAMKHNDGTA